MTALFLEKKNIIESSLIDSYDISLITPVITREDEDAQKPLFSKVSSRGWENRTPTKGFGDPYHTIWPIPYKVYYTYFQNYIHVDISLRINFLRCWLSFVLRGGHFVTSPLSFFGQALTRLVTVSSMCCHTSTSALSTSSSSRGFTSFEWDISS